MRISKQLLEDMPNWMKKHDDLLPGWIYIGDDEERYLLGQPGKRNMLVMGVNPSTAKPGEKNLDPTIRKVRKFVNEAGYDGWIMGNLYPLRATDPKNLPEKENKTLIKNNLAVLSAVGKFYPIDMVWAAWGNAIDERFYLGDALYDIEDGVIGGEWYYRGEKTKSGNPRHPLYMKSGEAFNWFPVADYAAEWRYANCVIY
ncbi:MAG: DUF1643 domain-containing protein [Lachnospiraceae bacterium]|nr:DUF1643 domain-containing protein [Lachnospiraceae bacterium]